MHQLASDTHPTCSASDRGDAHHVVRLQPSVPETASATKSQAPRPAARLTFSSSTSNTMVASRLVSNTDRSRRMDGNCAGKEGSRDVNKGSVQGKRQAG